MKYYQTEQFKKVNERWKKKLKEKGFNDLEEDDGRLKEWAYRGHINNNSISVLSEAKQTYYRLAGYFLYDHKFRNKTEKKIWEMHAEGVSYRDIGKKVNKSCTYIKVRIHRLKVLMQKRYKDYKDNEY